MISSDFNEFLKKIVKIKENRNLKKSNFSKLELQKCEGLRPSLFFNCKIEKFNTFKPLFFLDFNDFLHKFIENGGNHEKHNFFKNPKFNSQ